MANQKNKKNRILSSMQDGLEEPEWFSLVEPFMQNVMGKLKYSGEEVSILFCNDDFIRELNKNYREIDSATDVLSFENGDEYEDDEGKWLCVGDIIISLETLPKNAKDFEVDEAVELKRLLIHGLLHLNGMDHGDEHLEKGKTPECEMLLVQERLVGEV